MKHFLKIALVVGMLCSVVCMVACSGGNDPYAHAGKYRAVEIQSDDPDMVVSRDIMELMSALSGDVILQLNADGTGVFSFFGDEDVIEVTWSGTTVSMMGEDLSFSVSGETLSLEQDGSIMVFQKMK